jgi:formamidopyrimidine-DNA glycosylase
LPELPEVETVRRGLEPVLRGRRIERADVRREGLRWPFPPDMAARLTGATVNAVRRRSKYLLIDLDGGETLIVHLGMSGRILISGAGAGVSDRERAVPEKHDHVILDMAGGVRITLNDARRFGSMDLCETQALDAHRLLASLGPEPLGNAFDASVLAGRMAGSRAAVKAVLLDQRVVAGLGNIYVCEALWRAGVSPLRQALTVSEAEAEDLVRAIRAVLEEAIAAGGSSLRDFRQANGELGYFQHSFAVYGREGEPCARPECDGRIERDVQSGRSSFHCPQCQVRG